MPLNMSFPNFWSDKKQTDTIKIAEGFFKIIFLTYLYNEND